MNKHLLKKQGFTIVELLVVIVVIGILAAITIVSFTGIAKKAAVATIQSDLMNASIRLGLDKALDTSDSYPISEAAANGGRGLSKSAGTTYSYTLNGSSYCLSATSTAAGSSYHISTGGTIASGGCTSWAQMSVAGNYSCSVDSNGKAYCWGDNTQGYLGNNSTTQSLVAVAVDTTGVLSGKTVKSISVGSDHSCVIASDDLVYCWGYNWAGALGDNSTTRRLVPVAVNTAGVLSGKTIKALATGYGYTCAIASDDQEYCWGYGSNGQLGNNTINQSLVPVAVVTTGVLSGKTIKAIASNQYHTCAIASDNNAYCWGDGSNGEFGYGSTSNPSVPIAAFTIGPMVGKTVKSIAVGMYHICVIASDDLSYCAGNNSNGAFGNNTTTNSPTPTVVNTAGVLSGKTIKSLAAAERYTCAVASDNQAYCWGKNTNGQLGNNSIVDSLVPVAVNTAGVMNGKTLNSMMVGYNFASAVSSDNQVYYWGKNTNGAFGNNSASDSLVPVVAQSPLQ